VRACTRMSRESY